MDYGQTWPEPQAAPLAYSSLTAGDFPRISATTPLQHQHYAGELHNQQQPLSYSPYPTNPNANYYHYEYSSIQSQPKVQEPYAPHDSGYADHSLPAAPYPLDGAAPSADPQYPYSGEVSSAVAVGGSFDGVYGYGGEDPMTVSAKVAIRQYGAHPLGYDAAPFIANGDGLEQPTPYQNTGKPPKPRIVKKKALNKTTKVVQSAYCEVCKVDCNSQEVLKSHKEGKKHKKKLKKLQDSVAREAAKAQASEPAGTGETTADEEDTNKKRAASPETGVDLETKRSRILEAGAYADEVRVCTICNVVVNSQKVYQYHLDGQKHAAMVERLQEADFSL